MSQELFIASETIITHYIKNITECGFPVFKYYVCNGNHRKHNNYAFICIKCYQEAKDLKTVQTNDVKNRRSNSPMQSRLTSCRRVSTSDDNLCVKLNVSTANDHQKKKQKSS